MANVVIYTTSLTGVTKIKKDQTSLRFLLDRKHVSYTEKDVARDTRALAEAKAGSGKTDMPQLFVNDAFIGTYDDLLELEEIGELNAKLGL
ncbi:glutaredoxin [Streptomyces sp. NPDC060334]|uniref:glutaredoxin n=1 Tax=unclassified Streptomyces TaxID=2593676 RepID=UPI003654D5A4